MVKNVCQTYLKGLKEFHFKLFLPLALASGATRPRLGVSEHPPNPQLDQPLLLLWMQLWSGQVSRKDQFWVLYFS